MDFWLVACSYLCRPLDGSRKLVNFSSARILGEALCSGGGSALLLGWYRDSQIPGLTGSGMGARKGWDEAQRPTLPQTSLRSDCISSGGPVLGGGFSGALNVTQTLSALLPLLRRSYPVSQAEG